MVADIAECAGGAGTGTEGMLNGEELLIGVCTLPLLKLLTLLLQQIKNKYNLWFKQRQFEK